MVRRSLLALGVVVTLGACSGDKGGTETEASDPSAGTSGGEVTSTTEDATSATASSSGGETSADSGHGLEVCDSGDGGPPCDDPLDTCKKDQDRDGVPFSCDNAPDFTNPEQRDDDGDGFGDVFDTCRGVASPTNTADSDRDGIGNDCDLCKERPSIGYNKDALNVPAYMLVRNIPQQQDSDRDGIGDVCDNCVRTPNCQGFGDGDGLTPYEIGGAIDTEAADCQLDANDDKIGDACAGDMAPGAAGPVGFANADDFDQDGLANIDDYCPRQPVALVSCQSDADCPSGASCADAGICNHADHDGDGVGDRCDTCPGVANPMQIVDGGMQEDDMDEDFVGGACELNADCALRADPRRHGFYDVSANGYCCVTTYDGQPIYDPEGALVDVNSLGPWPPGVLELPPGCEEALAASPDGEAHPICEYSDPSELWRYFCLLPTWDQDFDGIGDRCDKCPFAHDPSNASYVDQNDKVWEDLGAACQGENDISFLDPETGCVEPLP